MNKRYFALGFIFAFVIIVSLYPVIVEAANYYGKFPPTNAFRNFTSTSGESVEAESYADELNLLAGSGITITGNNAAKSITFSSIGNAGNVNGTKDLIVDYLILKNSTHTYAQNGTTGDVDFIDVDSATLINQVMTQVNAEGGAWVHIKGYGGKDATEYYSITTAIQIPDSGRLTLTGDGRDSTVLRIPITFDNNIFEFTGVKVASSHFNYFSGLHLYGNTGSGGVTNTGFRMDSTGAGIGDSTWEHNFIERFAQDGVFFDATNSWNLAFFDNIFEYAERYSIYKLSGSDDKIIGNKFLYGIGTYALSLGGGYGTISGNFFYQNDKNAIELRGGASGYTIAVS